MTASHASQVNRNAHILRGAATALFLAALVLRAQAEAPAGIVPGGKLPALSELLPSSAVAELETNGKIVRTAPKGEGPSLLPTQRGAQAVAARLAAEKPSLLVEALYLYRRPSPGDEAGELREVYATLLGISTLQGIEYWSASRKKMRTFYAESWRIDGPETRIRLPDPSAPATGPLPALADYYAYQHDLTFGANVYRVSYSTFGGAVLLELVNMTTLGYYGIPVLKPDGLRVRLLVIQAREGLLFYATSAGDVPGLSVIRDKVEESVTNRAEALFKWFSARLVASRPRQGT